MFTEEASRLDELRRQVNHDALTGLPNRDFFMTWLSEALGGEQAAAGGALAIMRIADLDKINAGLGHVQTDRLIGDIGACLDRLASRGESRLAARLNGSDFALIVAGDEDAGAIAIEMRDALLRDVNQQWPELSDVFHIGCVPFTRNESVGDVLAAVDKALAMAENMGINACHTLEPARDAARNRNSEAWRQALGEALNQGRLRLENFPVLAINGSILHHEGAVRLQPEPEGSWLSAGEFMPMALRLKLSAKVDVGVIRMALEQLDQHAGQIAVNISAESIADWGFRDELIALLGHTPDLCRRLWLEVPEYGAFRNFDAFRSLCQHLAPLGCKLGIEHFGRNFGEIGKLAELGLDYLKVDSSYVREIDRNEGNQEFLKGLCKIAHTVGVQVIAEGVQSEQELETLLAIGFDAATGQAVTRKLSAGA
jgi:diguanylate cyclase (GGDEF)-like protein